MFASAGTVLKLHAITENQLEPISVYKPKRISEFSKITNLSWCHDNSYIAILQQDALPQIISSKDRNNMNLIHTIQALKNVTAIRFKQHTKRTMALGNAEGELILYDTKNRNILRRICELNNPIKGLEFNDNDEQLAIATDKAVAIYSDLDGVNNFVKEACYLENSSVLKYHPVCLNILALGYDNGCVTIRDTEKGEVIANFQKHCNSVTGINFTEKQKSIVTTGMDKKICIYDYTSSECLFRMNIHQAITSSDVSLDDIYLAVGLEDGSVSVYDIRNPLKPMITTNAHEGPVSKVSFERAAILPESPHDKPSGTTVNDNESIVNQSEFVNYELGNVVDEKFKQDMVKMVKNHMAYLEEQLNEHCMKFQNFIMNEFDSIHNAMSRWDVFNIGDSSEVAQALGAVGSSSVHSASSKKSHVS